jgi:outer membrane protein OmpA-like peptidoglycan-associated protein/class 3 adenylate cyclase
MDLNLAAIMVADLVDYTRLIRADEQATEAALNSLHADLFEPKLTEHNGRLVNLSGHSILAEFAGVAEAVLAAVEMQQALAQYNDELPTDRHIEFRFGINLGEVEIDGGSIRGEGVDVAAGVEKLAKPGGICISNSAHERVIGRTDVAFADLGERKIKNIDRSVRVWQWTDAVSVDGDPKPHGWAWVVSLLKPAKTVAARSRRIGGRTSERARNSLPSIPAETEAKASATRRFSVILWLFLILSAALGFWYYLSGEEDKSRAGLTKQLPDASNFLRVEEPDKVGPPQVGQTSEGGSKSLGGEYGGIMPSTARRARFGEFEGLHFAIPNAAKPAQTKQMLTAEKDETQAGRARNISPKKWQAQFGEYEGLGIGEVGQSGMGAPEERRVLLNKAASLGAIDPSEFGGIVPKKKVIPYDESANTHASTAGLSEEAVFGEVQALSAKESTAALGIAVEGDSESFRQKQAQSIDTTISGAEGAGFDATGKGTQTASGGNRNLAPEDSARAEEGGQSGSPGDGKEKISASTANDEPLACPSSNAEERLALEAKHRRWVQEMDIQRRPDIVDAVTIADALTKAPPRNPPRIVSANSQRVLAEPNINIAVVFDFDLAAISPEAIAQLDEIAKALKSPKLREYNILVEGHTDSIGSEQYNLGLSVRRAENVRLMLVKLFQISPRRLSTRGMGETVSIATNDTAEGRHSNRRVTFINDKFSECEKAPR